ncbi:hypothetical protein DRO29_06170 [Candidatus Bathyarchaeota archaeon]|nr:MAG: hypothetical protein DRO29_06170 [Candidatus Bathyarchaeota archaeon]
MGFKLYVAGNESFGDPNYARYIKSLCEKYDNVYYLCDKSWQSGEVSYEMKIQLMSHAKGIILPFLRQEAFSLIALEALACGCPVITFNYGAMPEIIEHGSVGYLCRDIFEMAEAVKKVDEIDPLDCRKHVKLYFSIEKSAEAYLKLYREILDGGGC